MSRFQRLSHVLWCCQYHIVWVPKYRYRVLSGPVAEEVHQTVHVFCGRLTCGAVELNVQKDHVHLLVKVPPKVSILTLMGTVKGKTAIQIFCQFPGLKQKPYWGNHSCYGMDKSSNSWAPQQAEGIINYWNENPC